MARDNTTFIIAHYSYAAYKHVLRWTEDMITMNELVLDLSERKLMLQQQDQKTTPTSKHPINPVDSSHADSSALS